jgi:release factor glutamine methyltransferase
MSTISIKKSLIYGTNELRMAGINSARLDAEIFISFLLGTSREKLISDDQRPMTNSQFNKYKKLIKKRAQHTPTAYLTGSKEFYGIDFYVNKNVLVPRPETETLIEEILNYESRIMNHELKILEIGTGSGCISLTLAKYLPKTNVIAVDVSEKSLTVARKNKKKLGIRNVLFKKSNLLSNIKTKPGIIVANLPYLTRDELKEPSITKEPHLALYGGKNGLEIYNKLFKQIKRTKWQNILLFIEIGENQAKKIREAIKEAFPNSKIEVIKDLNGKNRVVVIELKNLA